VEQVRLHRVSECAPAFYRDRIVYLGPYRAARPVRVLELLVDGAWWSDLASVLEPQQLPADAVWTALPGALDHRYVLRGPRPHARPGELALFHVDGVPAQIWTTLTIDQVPQDLRLDLAPAASLTADDISWTSMTRHIVWYIEQPEGKPPLRTWSKDNATHFALAKHGVHTAASRAPTGARSHGQLSRTGAACRPHRRPGPPAVQGKAEPVRPNIITVAGLRTSTGQDRVGAQD
jgi:hypothetical protein